MACPAGGTHKYILQGNDYVCEKCGHISPFHPSPTYTELLKENEQLKERIKELEGEDATRVYNVSDVP